MKINLTRLNELEITLEDHYDVESFLDDEEDGAIVVGQRVRLCGDKRLVWRLAEQLAKVTATDAPPGGMLQRVFRVTVDHAEVKRQITGARGGRDPVERPRRQLRQIEWQHGVAVAVHERRLADR